jgi:hypothetical protein
MAATSNWLSSGLPIRGCFHGPRLATGCRCGRRFKRSLGMKGKGACAERFLPIPRRLSSEAGSSGCSCGKRMACSGGLSEQRPPPRNNCTSFPNSRAALEPKTGEAPTPATQESCSLATQRADEHNSSPTERLASKARRPQPRRSRAKAPAARRQTWATDCQFLAPTNQVRTP